MHPLALSVCAVASDRDAVSRFDSGGSEPELRAIAVLHSRDVEASRTSDYATLQTLWSDDPVIMAPGQPLLRGTDALDQSFQQRIDQAPQVEVLSYDVELEEVLVLGDFAIEWGRIRGTTRSLHEPEGEPHEAAYKVMRILRKQDGVWRFHRAIWNSEPEP